MQGTVAILPSAASLTPPHFQYYPTNYTIFGKKVTEYKIGVLTFSTNLSKKFLIQRILQRDIVINMETSLRKVPVFRQILMKIKYSRQIFFKKSSNIKFHQNSSSGGQIVPCGRAD